jgi:Uma2 family endonuclease
MRLGGRLMAYVEDHDLGAVTGEAGGFDLSTLGFADTELGPDVAFTRAEHVPPRSSPVYAKAWPVAPDLAVEVASPNQHRPQMAAKAQNYLAAGTRLVWVVWPRRQQVDVWRPGAKRPSARGAGDMLDGEDVVPGFNYPIADLFK